MRLSNEQIKQHRDQYERTGYPVCPRDYLDTIEALQQENEVFKAAYEALCEQAEIQSQMMYRRNEVLKQVRAALKQVQHDIDRAECRVGGNEDV